MMESGCKALLLGEELGDPSAAPEEIIQLRLDIDPMPIMRSSGNTHGTRASKEVGYDLPGTDVLLDEKFAQLDGLLKHVRDSRMGGAMLNWRKAFEDVGINAIIAAAQAVTFAF